MEVNVFLLYHRAKGKYPETMKGTLMIGLLVVIFVRTYVRNKFSKSHNEPLFNPNPEFLSMTKDWEEVEDTFKSV
jgi:hypothetical protein